MTEHAKHDPNAVHLGQIVSYDNSAGGDEVRGTVVDINHEKGSPSPNVTLHAPNAEGYVVVYPDVPRNDDGGGNTYRLIG